ncbi:hypothetical protein B6D29_01695 [Microgenomates bacterium UTCPR1]|nr:MAG: hypothetical protein B6D29_01695 [Microgenomates bacterium UTCPR1]
MEEIDREVTYYDHQYYVDLAHKLPRVPPNEMTDRERRHGHIQYGNNLYLLFQALSFDRRNNDENTIQSYLKDVSEKDVKNWWTFVDNNEEFIQKIDKALDGVKQYDTLLSYFIELILDSKKTNNFTLVDEFSKLKIEEIGIFAWRNLNPLLEEAVKLMKKVGLKPEAFFL